MRTRGHGPADNHERCPKSSPWLAAIAALLLLAHGAQAHRHQMDAEAAMRAAQSVAPARVVVAGVRHVLMLCPVTQLVAPRGDASPAPPPIGFALLALLVVAFGSAGASARPAWPPRPPGPARQALLQRFTL